MTQSDSLRRVADLQEEIRLLRDANAEIGRSNEKMRATLRYLRAAAHLFPHVNTDRATTTQLGLGDHEDAWCLGCTISSTVEGFDHELMAGDTEGEWDERARRWMMEYEDTQTLELQEMLAGGDA